jgi:hypothetical protein
MTNQKTLHNLTRHSFDGRSTGHNSTFAIGGVSCSADSLVVAESFVLRINISGKKPAHRKSAKRYGQPE